MLGFRQAPTQPTALLERALILLSRLTKKILLV